jgi:hypothetical protein
MMTRVALVALFALCGVLPPIASAQDVLIPMDERQTNHLKAYGAAFWALTQNQEADWLLNYRGGAFLLTATPELEEELRLRNVSYERLSASASASLVDQVEADGNNQAAVRLETAPDIAVYAPDQTVPWDDAVLLALTYAEVPYDMIYDREVLDGALNDYDWLHLHHEDFTGQMGKFLRYRNTSWYMEKQQQAEELAREYGFRKISELKLNVAQTIRRYVQDGGFLFSMCLGTETLDLALAAHDTDIVPQEYDNDPVDPNAREQLDYAPTFAFRDFQPDMNPQSTDHSTIDAGPPPASMRDPSLDYFTLFDFSAQWDPVPTMLTQNHVATVKGFVGQTTAFNADVIKEGVVRLAEMPARNEVKYVHGTVGSGTFTFFAGHDPEDYQHFVGDPPTDLDLHPNSPGYRLILNNILFPAAKPERQQT